MILHDKFGRQITDLRISITDRCNFRCVYCRSADPENYRDHDEILSWPELDRLAGVFLSLGIRKIRITGGEPLVRDGVEDYIARLHALGVEDLSMTTNGQLLAERCDRLLAGGLRRINISLDSLDSGKFERITRTKSFSTVMHSIDVAQKSRLAPAKVNAVLVRGINDDEICDFARLTIDHDWHVRFIELMPVGEMRELTSERVVPSDEILQRLAIISPLTPAIGPVRGNGPARYFRLEGAVGTIGVITPMSHTYCGSCNRVRLTADGRLRMCLFGEEEVDLRTPLREGLPLEPFFRSALSIKPREHGLLQMRVGGLRALSQVGG